MLQNMHSHQGYAYAICLKEDNFPIGYIKVDMEEHHDFGYGLRKEFWHKGIVTEAGKAVVEQVKKDGLPYITATHDKNNPRSGNIMKKVGMKYCYSYEEQWQPKDISVIFRMYQLNFDGNTVLCTNNIGMSQTISLLKNYNFDIQISLRKIKIEFVYSKKQPGRYGCFLN